MTAIDAPDLNLDLSRPGRVGLLALVVLVGILGSWAASVSIGGAVIAAGQAVVHGKPKLVQTLDGGTIVGIHVAAGDMVEEGTLLLQLDATLLEANLDIAKSRLAAALTLRARLTAEQAGLEAPVFDYPALPFDPPDTTAHEQGEMQIFAARAAVMQGGRDRLAQAIAQFEGQHDGIRAQIDAIDAQITFLSRDMDNMTTLAGRGLVRQSQLSELQRSRAQLDGQRAGLVAEQARLADRVADSRLDLLQAERTFQEEIVTQLREVTDRIEELTLEIVTHADKLARVDILAPASGTVHELQATTLGGVVAPGETILQIVPLDTGLDFELRVDPRSIDQVHVGQTARLVVAALDPQSTPRLMTTVSSVSPGTVTDPYTGREFYRVSLTVPPDELAQLDGIVLIPGMPVEAYLETTERSVLSYLLHPITAHMDRALRE